MQEASDCISMGKFLTDPDYLGQSTGWRFAHTDLLKRAMWMGDQSQKHFTVYGEIGTGKTTLLQVLVCRMLYDISRQDAHDDVYGVNVKEDPTIVLMNENLESARRCYLDPIIEMLKASQYFKAFSDSSRFHREYFHFMDRVRVVIASPKSQDSCMGVNMIGLFMNSSAGTVDVDDRVKINTIIDRIKSRTMNKGWMIGASDGGYHLMVVPEAPRMYVPEFVR